MKRTIAGKFLLAALFAGTLTGGAAEASLPQQRLLPRLVDGEDLLDASQETNLLKQLDEISERQQCDVVVVTAEDLEGKTPKAYADDFYDYNGYGGGTDQDGMLLLVSLENRKWQISTYGFGTEALTDAGIEYISEQFLPDLKEGDYADAFETYASLCDAFITQAKNGEAYDVKNMPKEPLSPVWIPLSLLMGLGLALLITGGMRAQLKTVRRKNLASDYTRPGSKNLRMSRDIYLYRTVTRTERPKEEKGGGSSTHTSSSGRSHGGGGGSF